MLVCTYEGGRGAQAHICLYMKVRGPSMFVYAIGCLPLCSVLILCRCFLLQVGASCWESQWAGTTDAEGRRLCTYIHAYLCVCVGGPDAIIIMQTGVCKNSTTFLPPCLFIVHMTP